MPAPLQAPSGPLPERRRPPAWVPGMGFIPIVLLIAIGFLFVNSKGGGLLSSSTGGSAMILFDQTVLQPGQIALHIRNSSAQPATITTVNVNDGMLPFVLKPDGPVPPFGKATIYLLYPWVKGQAYDITVFTGDSASFRTSIDDAETTTPPAGQTTEILLLVGLAAGFLSVLCGISGYALMNRAGARSFLFLLAIAAGLLVYLAIALAIETVGNASEASGAFQGMGLLGVGVVLTFLFLNAVSGIQAGLAAREDLERPAQAWVMSAGVGLQNLAFGLAAGTAFNSDAAPLGTLLIIALTVLNLTQGARIIAAIERSGLTFPRLLGMGFVAGAPAALGIWLSGAASSQIVQFLLYSIGIGAVAQALYDIVQRIRRTTAQRPMPVTVFAGIACGILALYLASMLIV